MQRIAIIGSTGAGKSTLARRLSEILDLQWFSIDEYFWKPGWVEGDHDEVIEKYRELVRNERWVIEGNYGWLRPTIWERADTIIWLDYPFLFNFWQLWNRSVRRVVYKTPACNGNIETWKQLFSRKSILLWCITSRKKRITDYPIWLAKPEYAHLNKLIFSNAKQTQKWLDTLAARESTLC